MDINVAEIRKKISDRLRPSGWRQVLGNFLDGPDMIYIIEQLLEIKRQGEYFTPIAKDMFRFLEMCPVERVKVIVLIDVLNNAIRKNTGIPLEGMKTSKVAVSIYNTIEHKHIPDIQDWCKQGVLMVPVSPTTLVDSESNRDIWRSWTSYLVTKLSEQYPEAPVIMIGKKAYKLAPFIKSSYKSMFVLWPKVNSRNCWNWANAILKSQNQTEIRW